MRILLVCLLALIWASSIATADDDALSYYLSKSELVVVGEVESARIHLALDRSITEYDCSIKVSHVFRGGQRCSLSSAKLREFWEKEIQQIKPGSELKARVDRNTTSTHAVEEKLTNKGQQYVVFLRTSSRVRAMAWESTDRWFSVQPAIPTMIEHLAETTARFNKSKETLSTIKPGMTRRDVYKISRNDPQRDSREKSAYGCLDYPCLKVKIEFEAVGKPDSSDGLDSSRDKVLRVSEPFFEFTISDDAS
jgi:hypothetical protein